MGAMHGKQGKVMFAGSIASNIISWSVEASCAVADTTVMDSSAAAATTHWKSYLASFMNWTATIQCDLDDGGEDPDLAADFFDEDGITCVFHQGRSGTGGRKMTGEGIITGISPSVDKDDVVKVTYAVQGNGVLTMAADS